MVSQSLSGSPADGNINVGGQAVWALKTDPGDKVQLQFSTHQAGSLAGSSLTSLINDGNGQPDLIAARLGSTIVQGKTSLRPSSPGCQWSGNPSQYYLPKNVPLCPNAPAFQDIELAGATGRFVVLAEYRMKVEKDSTALVQAFLTCDNCLDMGNYHGMLENEVSNPRVLFEAVGIRAGGTTMDAAGTGTYVRQDERDVI